MNENGRKKREWIKTAAIVFLSVMLVLTFFSSTIQNWSLPEVATQYVQSGSITAKAMITGTVESVDPYEVKVTETRKVASVAVRTGDKVEKGDVLVYLEAKDSKELEEAKKALETAQNEYSKAILSEKYTAEDISEANKGTSAESYRDQITRAQNTVKAAEGAVKTAEAAADAADKAAKAAESAQEEASAPQKAEVDRIQQQIQDYQKQIAYEQSLENLAPQGISVAEAALENAKKELDNTLPAWENAKAELARAQKEYDDHCNNTASAGNAGYEEKKRELEEKLEQAKTNCQVAEWGHTAAQIQVDEAQNYYNDLVYEQAHRKNNILIMNAEIAQLEIELYGAQKELTLAQENAKGDLDAKKKESAAKQEELEARQKELEDKKEALTELVTRAGNVTGLETYLKAIETAQKNVDELSEKAGGATITAPIAGTISTINVTAGNETSAATPVVVMQREGQGFTLSYSATNEVAKRLSVGDVGELVNAWRYDDVTVTLASIKVDPESRGQKKLLTFNVTGSVVAGQSLSFSVGQKSANYNFIVPNSAVREDNNGKFILIVQSKSSPLGTRYTASRVDVEVIASDETQSAISGALAGYEFVITTSTKPVEAGNLVRLPD